VSPLDSDELLKILECFSTKEMWDTLEKYHKNPRSAFVDKEESFADSSFSKTKMEVCLMAKEESGSNQGCLERKQHLWYLDSGYSNHMTGDASKFINISLKQDEHVTYGDNNKGKILGKGTIGNENSFLIHDVLYVEGLKHNLFSISQLCDRGYQVTFRTNSCEI